MLELVKNFGESGIKRLLTMVRSTGNRRRTRRSQGSLGNSKLVTIALTVMGLVTVWLILGIFILFFHSSQSSSSAGGLRGDHVAMPSLTSSVNSFPPPYPKVSRGNVIDKESLDMCERTLWHTMETTTIVLPNQETFIHTGDIDDLWLRDSAAQVHPLLVNFGAGSLVSHDARLERVVGGLIKRCAWYIRHDPYANAFRIDDTYVFSKEQKRMGRHDFISTWNYELDSGCFYMRMLYFFYKAVPTNQVLRDESVRQAIEIMVDLWIAEQDHEADRYPTGPLFDCQNCNTPYRYPGLPRKGKGNPVAVTGMTWTGFRPSDDECKYGYLVPANMFAVVALRYMVELAPLLWHDTDELVRKASKLATEIDQGIQNFGIVNHPNHGRIFAYEVDGLGNANLMDDANVPSLMSIPYLGYDFDPQIYANTKSFILSKDNPTYQKGTNAFTGDIEGYGSPHMNAAIRNNIWPMSLAVQGLSSSSTEEKMEMVRKLNKSTGGTGWMHESFAVDNPRRFTRKWFCWADSLFAELVMSLTDQCPSTTKYRIMSWRDPVTVPGGPFAAD